MRRTVFALVALASALVASSASAQAPDFMDSRTVTQEQGIYSVQKTVEVYLDGNPGEPGPTCVPGDGLQCYVYTLELLSGSLVGIEVFRLSLEVPTCDPHTVSFNPGPKDPASAVIATNGARADWTFDPPLGGALATNAPETSSQLIVMSACAPGSMPDELKSSSYQGEFGFDTQGECLGPFEPIECELELEKTCRVDSPPAGDGDDCQGKVRRMVLEYTGAACNPAGNSQAGSASCVGDPAGTEPVEVIGDEDTNVAPAGEVVFLEDMVAVTAEGGGTLRSNTDLWVKQGGTPIQDLSIHTSCSKPLNVGDQFGSLTLVELTTTEGGTVRSPDGDGSSNVCQIAVLPAESPCRRKPDSMTLRYVGGDCTATQDQEGEFQCSGDAGSTDPVQIQLLDKDCDATQFDSGVPADVGLGDTFDADPPGDFESNTCVRVRDAFGALLQESRIHTSCSKPMRIGDRFGAIQIVGFDGQGQGAYVDYTYVATEANGQPVENVDIEDSPHGTIAENDSIPADGELSVSISRFITETTVNSAVVTGTVFGQECVSDSAVATVDAETIDIPTKKKKLKKKKKNKKRSSKKRGKKAMKKGHQHHPDCGH